MSVVAFIPARGGSKGVPKKNIKELYGKPLIAWTIENALKSEKINRVIVSTDCENIAEISREYGAEVPFTRPADISDDTASTESAMLHCCEYLNNNRQLPRIFILLQATSPIRTEGQLDKALKYMSDYNYDSVFSVCRSHRFFWTDKNSPSASYDYMNRPRRQDIKAEDQKYMETGSFYITKTDMLMMYKNRLCGRVGLFETPEDEGYEVDSEVDFLICEGLISKKIKSK